MLLFLHCQSFSFAFREFCDEFYKAYDSTYKRLLSLVHVVFGKLNNPQSYHFPQERQFIVYPPKAVELVPEEPIVQEGKVDYFTIDHTIWYMEEVGLYPEDVNRFGNCFFEAVSKQIFNFFDAATLREFTSAELVDYSDKYKTLYSVVTTNMHLEWVLMVCGQTMQPYKPYQMYWVLVFSS